MARTAMMEKAARKPRFAVRAHNRCQVCGRARAYYRKFKVCRICLRNLASEGRVPGMRKSSW